MPPQDKNSLKPAGDNIRFMIDGKGSLWFGLNNDQLVHFGKTNFAAKLKTPYRDCVFLDSGVLYLATDKYLGFIPELGKNLSSGGDGVVKVPFQPLMSLPAAECNLFAGEGGMLYVKGIDTEKGEENIYSFGGKGTVMQSEDKKSVLSYKEVFSVKKHITAVTGNGKKTYASMGRMIVEMTKGMAAIKGFFVHPLEEITGMAYGENDGLFYCTESCVGYAGENGAIDFIRARKPRIILRNNILYVFMVDNYGILKVENIDDMKKHTYNSSWKSGVKK
jgi:hypothetical protein